jgi:hypothetical protein
MNYIFIILYNVKIICYDIYGNINNNIQYNIEMKIMMTLSSDSLIINNYIEIERDNENVGGGEITRCDQLTGVGILSLLLIMKQE